MDRLTSKKYWEDDYENLVFQRQDIKHPVNQLIIKHVQETSIKTCIEIGSYPGPFLATIGDLGYELNGIDYNADNSVGMVDWLKKQNLKVNNFWVNDFFEFREPLKFDLVVSFGFIEHFKNFEEVIQRHIDLVDSEGMIIITTPNFRGWVQRVLHYILDRENYLAHNISSMRPKIWQKLLLEKGFEIQYSGYFGKFGFWVNKPNDKKGLAKFVLKFVFYVSAFFKKYIPIESSAMSCFCGIVAVKK